MCTVYRKAGQVKERAVLLICLVETTPELKAGRRHMMELELECFSELKNLKQQA